MTCALLGRVGGLFAASAAAPLFAGGPPSGRDLLCGAPAGSLLIAAS